MDSIGFLELNSIAKGIEAADAVIKAAEVGLVFAKVGCPGKYYLLFSGEVAAVQAALDAGCAIGMTTLPEEAGAVGVMEFYSVTASIYGADAAVKAVDVSLLDVRLGTGIGGKSFVILVGDVAAVTESVRCGIHTPNAEGTLVASVVIPNPNPEPELYKKLGVIGNSSGALGILTITPSEGAIIGADVATKAANVDVVFVDRFNGSLVINGDVASVESALRDVLGVLSDVLGFTLAASITRT